ncbi:PEPxxWA-CTERM sorting domain-containing protein [Phenylobacterium sp.]|uniref:PEPxxWA-CTERM sorting domain-containing protein n=1 Tax=Phenylobacterium sp. TaxID=1871053 RepID=UPI00374CD4A9
MNKAYLFGAVVAAQLALAGAAMADTGPVYSAYQGSQLGVTERNAGLVQQNSFNTGVNASGIAVNATDIFLAAGNHLIDYTKAGGLVQDFAFPDAGINYSGVATKGAKVYATYTGSQQGVTVRDLSLTQSLSFGTGLDATGIAAGDGGHLYLTSANHILDYLDNGSLINDMTFPDAGILYSAVAYANSTVYAAYQGSQQGVTVRDLGLNQSFFFGVNFNISGIAVGQNNDLYLSSGNHLYDYSTGGVLLNTFTFPDTGIIYKAIATDGAVPEPASWALMIVGFGLAGSALRRRAGRKALV